jgi:GLPGLI family protein
MKFILFVIAFLTVVSVKSQTDSTVYLCKYNYTRQTDSTDKNALRSDIMYLAILKDGMARYYSHLHQIGLRRAEEMKGKPLAYIQTQAQTGTFNAQSEKEIMITNLSEKLRQVSINFKNNYTYTETVEVPKWRIHNQSTKILGQHCQKASCTYKGRNYIAWFATAIPYRLGPWQFVGLPGLVLRISDDKGQFTFECTALSSHEHDSTFRTYTKCITVPKKKVEELKYLFESDLQTFDQVEWGINWYTTKPDGTKMITKSRKQPYNPIDLSIIH